MRKIEFDIKLSTKDLYFFTLRHTYVSLSGVFSLFISFGCLILLLARFHSFDASSKAVLTFMAVLFTVIQPIILYGKCNTQIKKNKDINEALHYTLSEDEVCVTQGTEEARVKWYDIRKVVYTGSGVYLYMSPVRAFIFPKAQCGGQFDEMKKMIMECVKKYKNYVPEEKEEQEQTHIEQQAASQEEE